MKLSARNGRWNYDNRAMVGEENGVVGEEAEIVPPVCIGWKLVRVSLKLEIFDRKRTRVSLEEELTVRSTASSASRESIPSIGQKNDPKIFLGLRIKIG